MHDDFALLPDVLLLILYRLAIVEQNEVAWRQLLLVFVLNRATTEFKLRSNHFVA